MISLQPTEGLPESIRSVDAAAEFVSRRQPADGVAGVNQSVNAAPELNLGSNQLTEFAGVISQLRTGELGSRLQPTEGVAGVYRSVKGAAVVGSHRPN